MVAEQPDILGSLSPAVSRPPHMMPQTHSDHLKSSSKGLAHGFQLTALLQEFVVISCSLMLRVKAMPSPTPSRNLIIFFKGEYAFFLIFIFFNFLFLNLF